MDDIVVTTGTKRPKKASKLKVALVSGRTVDVQTAEEKKWFEATRDRYLDETRFQDVTDQQDLDRLLIQELMLYRYTCWLASGSDYEYALIEEDTLQRQVKLLSTEITNLKDSMGLSKKARDADANRGDFASYLANLKERARHFGIHREEQLTTALALMNEIMAVAGAYLRADDEERSKMGFENPEQVLSWIDGSARERYEAVDKHFRENDQKFWIRDL